MKNKTTVSSRVRLWRTWRSRSGLLRFARNDGRCSIIIVILFLLCISFLPFLSRAEPVGPVGPVDTKNPQEIPEEEGENTDEKVEPAKNGVDVPYKPDVQADPAKEVQVKDSDFVPLNPPKKEEVEPEIVVPFISSKEPVFLGEPDPDWTN